jgi:hypothetical protein
MSFRVLPCFFRIVSVFLSCRFVSHPCRFRVVFVSFHVVYVSFPCVSRRESLSAGPGVVPPHPPPRDEGVSRPGAGRCDALGGAYSCSTWAVRVRLGESCRNPSQSCGSLRAHRRLGVRLLPGPGSDGVQVGRGGGGYGLGAHGIIIRVVYPPGQRLPAHALFEVNRAFKFRAPSPGHRKLSVEGRAQPTRPSRGITANKAGDATKPRRGTHAMRWLVWRALMGAVARLAGGGAHCRHCRSIFPLPASIALKFGLLAKSVGSKPRPRGGCCRVDSALRCSGEQGRE